jgi:hypothetical protein
LTRRRSTPIARARVVRVSASGTMKSSVSIVPGDTGLRDGYFLDLPHHSQGPILDESIKDRSRSKRQKSIGVPRIR